MFQEGSRAQEEGLCHSPYYEWNKAHKNKALYLNRTLYSPDILFSDGWRNCFCDVITCAAPNKSAAQKYRRVSDVENLEALKSRIRFVLSIAKHQDVDTFILGAFGCGVFGQQAQEVAGMCMARNIGCCPAMR